MSPAPYDQDPPEVDPTPEPAVEPSEPWAVEEPTPEDGESGDAS